MSDGERWELQTQSHGASTDAAAADTRYEYRMLTIGIGGESRKDRVGDVDVGTWPNVDDAMRAMALDRWDVHNLAIYGNDAYVVFRRPRPPG
jgi:hypothetical protein